MLQLVLAADEETGGQCLADSDSGEEYNGSLVSHLVSDAESGSDTDTDCDSVADRGNLSWTRRRRLASSTRQSTTGMSVFSVLYLVMHTGMS